MKIGILTMFSGLSEYYSLVNIVSEQIYMMLQESNDIEIVLIVTEDCKDEKKGIFADDRIIWKKISTNINGRKIELGNFIEEKIDEDQYFNEDIVYLSNQFEEVLRDIDVCIMHDILYLYQNYKYNMALRKARKKVSKTKFLSFCHSYPLQREKEITLENFGVFTHMENTIHIAPSQSCIPALAKQYNVPESFCRVVHNTIPIISNCTKEVQDLHRKVNLMDTEILVTYPARFVMAKRFEKVAALCGSLKKYGNKSIKIIFCDSSKQSDYKEYIKYVKDIGKIYGLNNQDIVFASEQGYIQGLDRKSVLDLFELSNLYICPSFSESFSLTTLEAAQKGNFLILNKSVEALNELGNNLGAYFMKWDGLQDGYRHKQIYPEGEEKYYEKNIYNIIKLMKDTQVTNAKTKIRTRYNSDWVWKNQLKPLIYGFM